MKRIFTVIAACIVAGGMLFAASGNLVGDGSQPSLASSFNLTLNLGSGTEVGWFKQEPTVENWGTAALEQVSEEENVAFADGLASGVTLWAAVKSNEAAQLKLAVTGEALSSGKVDTTIGIHASSSHFTNGNDIEWDGTDDSSKTISMNEADKVSTSRIVTGEIVFTMDAEDYNNALSADDYSADITLTVTSMS